MSTIAISYGSLEDAAEEARTVAKRLDTYRSSLYESVYRKLCSYDISQGAAQVSAKLNELSDRRDFYSCYGEALLELRALCQDVDKVVKERVSELTASFKESNGIRSDVIGNMIAYLGVSLKNTSSSGRFLGDRGEDIWAAGAGLKDWIRDWFRFDGGKEFLKGTVVGALEVALGVLAVVSAFAAGGAVIVVIAGVVSGLIGLTNGLANMMCEWEGMKMAGAGEAAVGRRWTQINSCQDFLRSSFIFGADGEYYGYNAYYHEFAAGMDVVMLVSTAATAINRLGSLVKNGYKWVTQNAGSLREISWKEVFSRDTLVSVRSKINDVEAAFKMRGWAVIQDLGSQMVRDMGRNLREEFLDFSSLKDGCASLKHIIHIPRTLLAEDFSVSTIVRTGISNILLPSLTVFTVDSMEGTIIRGEGGQLQWDFTEKVTAGDLAGLLDKGKTLGDEIGRLFSSCTFFASDVSWPVMNTGEEIFCG